jgi:hypothetical protein
MALSLSELHSAFMRTSLSAQGYSFQSAMNCQALEICITRLATIAKHKFVAVKTAPPYWWNKY